MSTPIQPPKSDQQPEELPEQPETQSLADLQHAEPQPTAPQAPGKPRIPKWLHRVELFLRVIVRIYVGVLVVLLPWTRLWDSSPYFAHHPEVAVYLMHGAARGLVSGLGLLNLWIALQDAVHYRDM